MSIKKPSPEQFLAMVKLVGLDAAYKWLFSNPPKRRYHWEFVRDFR